jgi:hypothetical protein
MGREAAMVEREGGPERNLILRNQPVGCSSDATATSSRYGAVGRRSRLVQRLGEARRHSVECIRECLVSTSGRFCSAWESKDHS